MLTTSIDTATSLILFEIGTLLLVLRKSIMLYIFYVKIQVYLNAAIPFFLELGHITNMKLCNVVTKPMNSSP